MNIKMMIQYDGSRYEGWQKQTKTDNTIQGKIEKVLSEMTGSEIEVHGSGRTDAGVHAKGQVANAHIPEDFTCEQVMDYCNQYLPEDIAVISCEKVPERFHARLNAIGKTYRYTICMGKVSNVFERKYQFRFAEPLDIEKMREAAALLIGTHDFRSFCGNRKFKKSTVRTVDSITIKKEDNVLLIDYHGDGFLMYMVRIMTGTLLEIGLGKRNPEDITNILAAEDRKVAGFTAPPQGLALLKVDY